MHRKWCRHYQITQCATHCTAGSTARAFEYTSSIVSKRKKTLNSIPWLKMQWKFPHITLTFFPSNFGYFSSELKEKYIPRIFQNTKSTTIQIESTFNQLSGILWIVKFAINASSPVWNKSTAHKGKYSKMISKLNAFSLHHYRYYYGKLAHI